MASHIVWGLQHLKQKLKNHQQAEFAEVEDALLDLRHQKCLFPEQTELDEEIADLLQKCDTLARTCTPYTLAELCMGQPATHFRTRATSPDTTLSTLDIARPHIDLPDVQMHLLTHQVPISYCYQQNANPQNFPLVTLIIDTRHMQNICTAIIDISFAKYGFSAPHSLAFQPGQVIRLEFLPPITRENMRQITEKCTDSLLVSIRYLQPAEYIWEDSCQVYLLSYNTALLWRYRWDRTLHLCVEYLVGWVTPHEPEIDKWLRIAAKYHPEQAFHGYNFSASLSKEGQRREVRKIVRAIFQMLHQDLKVRYITSALLTPSDAEPHMQCIQWVRLPTESISAGGSTNCLDGSVLFASFLELASLYPALLLFPDHALVGWRVSPENQEYEFLETTLIDQGNFEQAWHEGQQRYQEACSKGILGKEPHSLVEDYALLIDIQKCRALDILSL